MANGITTGAVTVDSTFECISVTAAFTNDDNGNATCLVEYRPTGGGSYFTAFTPFIDRRATITGSANPYVNQARVSIVGLTPGTSYDVRVTWSDADGVTGTNPISSTLSTLAATPTTGGASWYIDTAGSNGSGTSGSPFNNMASALTAASAGDTINCAGAFPADLSITKSGSSGAWIKFQQWSGHTAATFSGVTTPVYLTGSYLWFYGMAVSGATGTSSGKKNNITVDGSSNYVRIENVSLTNVCPNGDPSGSDSINYGSSAIFCNSGSHHVYGIGNTMTCSSTGVVSYHTAYSFGFGIAASPNSISTFIVKGNSITGSFRDGVSSEGNAAGDGYHYNCDIYNNTPSGCFDDQIEVDGDGINLRVWNNDCNTTGGNDCLSTAGISYGPTYIFRNYLHGQGLAVKNGNTSPGPVYYIHNTIDVTNGGPNGNSADGLSDAGGTPSSMLVTSLNNIYKTERYCLYQCGQSGGGNSVRGNSYNYDCLYSVPAAGYNAVADQWDYATTYTTIANLRTGTAGSPDFSQQETNGISADPLLNSNGTLQTGSPCIDAALAINNFNGANSAWPNTGSGPDMGAFEFAGAAGGSKRGGKVTVGGKCVIN